MAPPNNPQVVRCALVFNRDTRTFVNTFHVAKTTSWVLSDMQALAQKLADWWTNSYRGASNNQVVLTQVQTRLYDPSNPLAYDLNVTSNNAGQKTGTPDTGASTLSASLRTGLAGRKYRGRFYTVGMEEGDIANDDRVTSSYLGYLAPIVANLLVDVATLGLKLVIFHRGTNLWTEVISYVLDNVLDSQRRRLPGRGR